jgi:uncharacterized protein (DUF849 family)
MTPSDKLIINAAISGAVLTQSDTPFLPISVDEIVDCARRVREEIGRASGRERVFWTV